MADIQLTPEELLSQSTEMFNLQNEYQSLFQQVKNSLEGINSSWSPNLASNFSGKITSAQNSFSSIINMFGNGANAAKASALRFGTPSSWLQSIMNTGNDIYEGINTIASADSEEIEQIFGPSNSDSAEGTGKTLKELTGLSAMTTPAAGVISTVEDHFDADTGTWSINNQALRERAEAAGRGFEECINSGDILGSITNAGDYLTAAALDAGGDFATNTFSSFCNGLAKKSEALGSTVDALNGINRGLANWGDRTPVVNQFVNTYRTLGLIDQDGSSVTANALHVGLKVEENILRATASGFYNLM